MAHNHQEAVQMSSFLTDQTFVSTFLYSGEFTPRNVGYGVQSKSRNQFP